MTTVNDIGIAGTRERARKYLFAVSRSVTESGGRFIVRASNRIRETNSYLGGIGPTVKSVAWRTPGDTQVSKKTSVTAIGTTDYGGIVWIRLPWKTSISNFSGVVLSSSERHVTLSARRAELIIGNLPIFFRTIHLRSRGRREKRIHSIYLAQMIHGENRIDRQIRDNRVIVARNYLLYSHPNATDRLRHGSGLA